MNWWKALPVRRRLLIALVGSVVFPAIFLAGMCSLLFVWLPVLHVGRPFLVRNQGMAPVIFRGESIYMNELAFETAKPARGDIVCFRGNLPTLVRTGDWQVKRIVGLPGETLSIRSGTLYVEDHPAPELARFHYAAFEFDRFLNDNNPSFTVPADTYFVLGDYPDGSYDSRFFGPVPIADIKGRAVFRFWPPFRMGLLR